MANTARKRNDPRREATRVALIEAAETLFAELGVEAVSARQIGAAIGSLNTNVVAYHFGGKDQLIQAVFHHRLPAIDARRAELLAELEAAGRPLAAPNLLRVFALPLFEQTDGAGKHSFARFLAALERSGLAAARGLVIEEYPETERVTDRLNALLPSGAQPDGRTRMRLVVSMLSTMLQIIDRDEGLTPTAALIKFESAIAMAAAAFAVPQ
ncbi:TetR family transcriptional regulator [Phenylobacterium sp. LjRoot225]|uniref:TetR/AcrR family transcriptional regulator n=1 Tax=Phenylobacterium sp. LjRoot225 TaxID=3342285 RepID=UPI003ECC2B8C